MNWIIVFEFIELDYFGGICTVITVVAQLTLLPTSESVDLLAATPKNSMIRSTGDLEHPFGAEAHLDRFELVAPGFEQSTIFQVVLSADGEAHLVVFFCGGSTTILIDYFQLISVDAEFVDAGTSVRLDDCDILVSIVVLVHTPNIELIGARSHCKRLSNFDALDGAVLFQGLLDDLEVV